MQSRLTLADAPSSPAQARPRHWGLALSFLLLVVIPTAIAAIYLYSRAADQYASTVGFSVRKEEFSSPIDLLGGVADFGSTGSSDTDILYEYIQSQELVQNIDDRLDLRTMYSKPDGDPVFSLSGDESVEDLVDYWRRMTRVTYDAGTGLIELRVLAFDPQDAQAIATAIFEESTTLINGLSAIAREDATRYAREELDQAVERLKAARENMTAFRSRTQIVDPSADIQGQMGLLNTLQTQLAEALIETDLLRENTRSGDIRITQNERRIAVIRERIADERRKLGVGGAVDSGEAENYATLISDFERLSVDREFAEQTYTAALAALDVARAEARRQSRYLAAYIRPTLAETSQYPARLTLLGLGSLFLLLGWSIGVLIYYSVRDRR